MLQDKLDEEDNTKGEIGNKDLLRVDLTLDLRAQIEQESRKITSQKQSKKSRKQLVNYHTFIFTLSVFM